MAVGQLGEWLVVGELLEVSACLLGELFMDPACVFGLDA